MIARARESVLFDLPRLRLAEMRDDRTRILNEAPLSW